MPTHVLDWPDEDFAITAIAGVRAAHDRVHKLFHHLVTCDDLETNLFDKFIKRNICFLGDGSASKATHVCHSHAGKVTDLL